MSRVSFAPRALVDYEAAARWYHQQHPEVGRRFHRAVNDCLKRIAAAPRLSPRSESGTRRAFLRQFPYSLYYIDAPSGVHIVAIVHGRRHPDTWSSGFGAGAEEKD